MHHPPPMFIAALFTTAKTWKQPKCPSVHEWIVFKCGIIYNAILAIKKKKILPFATKWMDVESAMLSDVSQTEKDK